MNVLAIFETPRRAKARTEFDWGYGLGTKVVRLTVAGDESASILLGENTRILAARLAEQLKQAFEPE